MRIFFKIFLFLLLHPVNLHAQVVSLDKKCSNVINQNEAVNLENVRDQDSIGWCYAYAAADLLSFKLNKKISAVSLYYTDKTIESEVQSPDSSQGSSPLRAIENYLSKKSGFCTEEALPSSDFAFCAHDSYRSFLSELYTSIRSKQISNLECVEENIRKAFPLVDLGDMFVFSGENGTDKLVEFLYDKHCKNNLIKNFKPDLVDYNRRRYSPSALLTKIDEYLNRGHITAIGYEYQKVDPGNLSGDHASIVMGRRLNQESGECEYLIRNSWGKTCGQNETRGLSCHRNCNGGECRYSGHFWVNGEKLSKSLINVTGYR